MKKVYFKQKKASESSIQKAFFKWLSFYPKIRCICYAIPNGGYRKSRNIQRKDGKTVCIPLEAKRMKEEGVTSGVPDICIAAKSVCGKYNSLYIEFKAHPNKLTDNQKIMKSNLEENGNKVVVCYGWEEAKKEVEMYFGFYVSDLKEIVTNGKPLSECIPL